jgi:hypothetical protein
VRTRLCASSLPALVAAGLLAACDQPPTSPGGPGVPTGLVILRAVVQSSCNVAGGGTPFIPEVRTRIIVSQSGSDWIGMASSPAAGTVEVRFHETSTSPMGAAVTGTVKGMAIHMPELIPSPVWDARIDFGADGHAVLNGVTFGGGPLGAKNGVDGVGSGAITASDTSGRSCTGNAFSWSLAPAS